MLHVWGWVLIGEKLLGLPVSGVASLASKSQPASAKVLEAVSAMNEQSSQALGSSVDHGSLELPAKKRFGAHIDAGTAPNSETGPPTPASGRISPSNPLPRSAPGKKTPNVAANLIKSAITFTLSVLHHDCSSLLLLLDKLGRGEKELPLGLMVTPFFMIQPLGLVVEAIVKRRWRAVKKSAGVPDPVVKTIEFIVGNTWTWVWLGWTARWYVRCLSEIGAYQAFPNKPIFSITEMAWDYFRNLVVSSVNVGNSTATPTPPIPFAV